MLYKAIVGITIIGTIVIVLDYVGDKRTRAHRVHLVKASIPNIVQEGNKKVPVYSDIQTAYSGTVITKYEQTGEMELTKYLMLDKGYNPKGKWSASARNNRGETFGDYFQDYTIAVMCKDPEMIDNIEAGMVYRYVYKFENGITITDFKVSQATCDKFWADGNL